MSRKNRNSEGTKEAKDRIRKALETVVHGMGS